MAQLCSERVEGRLTEILLLGLLAQKVLTFYRPICSFPLYLARQNCSDPFCSYGSSAAEGTCLWPCHGEAEATATLLSCQPGADMWLVAKPAAQAQGKPLPMPGDTPILRASSGQH